MRVGLAIAFKVRGAVQAIRKMSVATAQMVRRHNKRGECRIHSESAEEVGYSVCQGYASLPT